VSSFLVGSWGWANSHPCAVGRQFATKPGTTAAVVTPVDVADGHSGRVIRSYHGRRVLVTVVSRASLYAAQAFTAACGGPRAIHRTGHLADVRGMVACLADVVSFQVVANLNLLGRGCGLIHLVQDRAWHTAWWRWWSRDKTFDVTPCSSSLRLGLGSIGKLVDSQAQKRPEKVTGSDGEGRTTTSDSVADIGPLRAPPTVRSKKPELRIPFLVLADEETVSGLDGAI
jgi:hypothetical protein